MKLSIIFSAFILFYCSCNNQESPNNNSKMVLGSPKAVVMEDVNTGQQKGPLAYGPNVPKVQDDDTIEVKFDITHRLYQIKQGVQMGGWLFGDSIPGPVLKIRVGQTVKFSMTNRSSDSISNMNMAMNMENMEPMQHSIDFHAAMVNPADKYRSIAAGETIYFIWTANYPGVFMYHCGTPMVLLHMISGMVGMVIVEPKDGFPGHVDREFALVQNEYYIKSNGSYYSADTSAALLRQPSYVAFNGKVSQYLLHPIHAKAGERIRVYFLNVGPNNISSFHVIGTIFDKVWLDGNPANQLVGMQAALVGPAQGSYCRICTSRKGSIYFSRSFIC